MPVFSKMASEVEPLMIEDDNRLTIFPIKHPDIWDMYQKAVSTFWVPEEIDFSRDIDDWNALGENEHYFIKPVSYTHLTLQTIYSV